MRERRESSKISEGAPISSRIDHRDGQGLLAACSWSLRPEGPEGLARDLALAGVQGVQLHLNPLGQAPWTMDNLRASLGGLQVVSGMFGPLGEDYSTLETIRRTGGVRMTEMWDANRQAAEKAAAWCKKLSVGLVTLHAGFVPPDGGDPEHGVMVERVAWLAGCFGGHGARLALETGQERAETLVRFLEDVDRATDAAGVERVGVNFDPANMILYGMGDPIEALRLLRRRVVQVHIKDALPSATPGEWGREVVVGTGGVRWMEFFEVLREGAMPPLVIEREAGETRVEDIREAARVVRQIGRRT